MANNAVSPTFKITSQPFLQQSTNKVTRFNLESVNPPSIAGDFSEAVLKYINPYPDIAFEKIILPQWEGISNFTTQVSNQPDYIKDYHIISLMRCCDYINSPHYKGQINGNTNPPIPVGGG